MIQLLRAACYAGGRLRQVRELPLSPDSPLTYALELRFDSVTLSISAVDEDDTVALSLSGVVGSSPVHSDSTWSLCIGKPLQWAWLMTNQQGYTDGVRLEFNDPDSPGSEIVDLVVAASSINVYRAQPIEA